MTRRGTSGRRRSDLENVEGEVGSKGGVGRIEVRRSRES